VIGTEVPPAGGAKSNENQLEITSPQRAQETLQEIQKQFYKLGLEHAWQQVIALVVQPGVEFGDAAVHPYQPAQAAQLSQLIEHYSGIIFEAHSTDYQTRTALRQLVQDHFAILKVGPALTFAYREAVFALEWIERELLGNTGEDCLSRLSQVLEAEMLANPKHWQKYYAGSRDIDITSDEQRLARRFSLSDRIRYYWPRPPVQQALERLLNNLQERQIPLSLVSQFFPLQFPRVLEAELAPHPLELIQARIDTVLQDYNYACYML
jgi:D-tagatose-1,6-bisphosphate aldolase subunit GatZ/KbaZ